MTVTGHVETSAPTRARGDARRRRRRRQPATDAARGSRRRDAATGDRTASGRCRRTVEEDVAELPASARRRERDEYLDTLRRLQADFENYKKRMDRQQTRPGRARRRRTRGRELLPVLDAFDLARAHLGDADEPTPEGKALVQAPRC